MTGWGNKNPTHTHTHSNQWMQYSEILISTSAKHLHGNAGRPHTLTLSLSFLLNHQQTSSELTMPLGVRYFWKASTRLHRERTGCWLSVCVCKEKWNIPLTGKHERIQLRGVSIQILKGRLKWESVYCETTEIDRYIAIQLIDCALARPLQINTPF